MPNRHSTLGFHSSLFLPFPFHPDLNLISPHIIHQAPITFTFANFPHVIPVIRLIATHISSLLYHIVSEHSPQPPILSSPNILPSRPSSQSTTTSSSIHPLVQLYFVTLGKNIVPATSSNQTPPFVLVLFFTKINFLIVISISVLALVKAIGSINHAKQHVGTHFLQFLHFTFLIPCPTRTNPTRAESHFQAHAQRAHQQQPQQQLQQQPNLLIPLTSSSSSQSPSSAPPSTADHKAMIKPIISPLYQEQYLIMISLELFSHLVNAVIDKPHFSQDIPDASCPNSPST